MEFANSYGAVSICIINGVEAYLGDKVQGLFLVPVRPCTPPYDDGTLQWQENGVSPHHKNCSERNMTESPWHWHGLLTSQIPIWRKARSMEASPFNPHDWKNPLQVLNSALGRRFNLVTYQCERVKMYEVCTNVLMWKVYVVFYCRPRIHYVLVGPITWIWVQSMMEIEVQKLKGEK